MRHRFHLQGLAFRLEMRGVNVALITVEIPLFGDFLKLLRKGIAIV